MSTYHLTRWQLSTLPKVGALSPGAIDAPISGKVGRRWGVSANQVPAWRAIFGRQVGALPYSIDGLQPSGIDSHSQGKQLSPLCPPDQTGKLPRRHIERAAAGRWVALLSRAVPLRYPSMPHE